MKVFLIVLLSVGVIFAKERKNNSRMAIKKVKVDYSFIKDKFQNNEDNQLERKRSHKRRRKIRKPIKGLR